MFFNIKKQIEAMAEVLYRIEAGDYKQKVPTSSNKEINKLSEAINNIIFALQKKIENLEKQASQVQAIVNSMVEGVVAVDKDARMVSINPTIEKIFNVSKDDTEGMFFLEAIRNNDIFEIINTVLHEGRLISQELSLVWPVERIFQINASPIFDKDKVSGCIVVIHDITEIRKLEMMRRDFVANVSHELKTPLTSIKGFVETLLEGALEDKENSRHFLEIIRDHTNRLDNLINDLLQLSYIESKEIKLELGRVNLRELTDKVLSGFKSQLNNESIEVRNDLSAKLSTSVDKNKMEQVLTNLIDNAIKFNKEKGFIKIYAEDLAEKVKFTVEDSGIGIPPKDIPRIFERFYRVDKARSRELGGTGLGLSIVKHIIELHGGDVGVESTEGLGSKFWFILPK